MNQAYLLNQKQSKTGSSFSTWENISGVPQGSILGLLLFNISCDLPLEYEHCCFTNYAFDTTPYVIANNTVEEIENFTILLRNFLLGLPTIIKVNNDKCHLLLSTQDETNIQIANTTIKYCNSKKLLELFLITNLNLTNMLRTFGRKQAKK